ncbi:MAG: ABC transporter permease [Flexilinea flocculi]|nr:ABC transporter permease [Flexilinea flocculi]
MDITSRKKSGSGKVTLILKENVPWIMLLVFSAFFAILFPQFLTFRNITNVLRNSAMIGTIAIGMTFAMIAGTFDLSVGSTMGLAAIITIKMQPQTGGTALAAVVIALIMGAMVGLINGLVVGRYRINSIITTIGIEYVILGITLVYSKGQHVWVEDMYKPLEFVGKGKLGTFPFPIIIFLVAAVIGQLLLSKTRFGCQLYATGGNPIAAELSGINIGKVRVIAYMISGFTAAVAGIMIAARTQNLDPSFGFGQETDVLTCVLLGGVSLYGGKGSIFGTLAGVLILYIVSNAMTLSGASYELQLICKGLIFLITVAASVSWQKKGK